MTAPHSTGRGARSCVDAECLAARPPRTQCEDPGDARAAAAACGPRRAGPRRAAAPRPRCGVTTGAIRSSSSAVSSTTRCRTWSVASRPTTMLRSPGSPTRVCGRRAAQVQSRSSVGSLPPVDQDHQLDVAWAVPAATWATSCGPDPSRGARGPASPRTPTCVERQSSGTSAIVGGSVNGSGERGGRPAVTWPRPTRSVRKSWSPRRRSHNWARRHWRRLAAAGRIGQGRSAPHGLRLQGGCRARPRPWSSRPANGPGGGGRRGALHGDR